MRLLGWLCLLLPFQLATSLPTPSTDSHVGRGIDPNPLRIIESILSIVANVIGFIVDVVDTLEDENAAESQFTTSVVSQLAAQYPEKNILIYHDQNSNATGLVNATHQHVEFTLLDIAIFDFTKGYEVFVFDYGTFYRAGDGGYENWCTWGEFDEYDDNTEIVYYPIS